MISPGDLALLCLCAPGSEESFIRGVRGLINYTGKELEGREGDRQGRRPQWVTWRNKYIVNLPLKTNQRWGFRRIVGITRIGKLLEPN